MAGQIEHHVGRIIRLKDVIEMTGMSASTIRRQEDRCQFPKRVKITKHLIGWREADVKDWLSNPEAWMAEQQKDI